MGWGTPAPMELDTFSIRGNQAFDNIYFFFQVPDISAYPVPFAGGYHITSTKITEGVAKGYMKIE